VAGSTRCRARRESELRAKARHQFSKNGESNRSQAPKRLLHAAQEAALPRPSFRLFGRRFRVKRIKENLPRRAAEPGGLSTAVVATSGHAPPGRLVRGTLAFHRGGGDDPRASGIGAHDCDWLVS